MIRPSQRALGSDALRQVLDNGVFRILAFAALLPILIFTVVQVTPTEIRLLFGLWSWPLENVAQIAAPEGAANLQAATLGMLLDLIFFNFAGKFGVLFCLAATSFFVPRMLEKGAADVLFHKPISRLRFYLSRYIAGLLFICLLSLVSATGVYLALTLVSGFSDPGVFAMVPALTYVFGLIFPVSMLIGTLTRSTVASILLSGVFFMGNGCVHGVWISHEVGAFDAVASASSGDSVQISIGESSEAKPSETSPAEATPSDATESDQAEPTLSPWRHLWTVLDVLHFSSPKTSAVPFLTAKLRAAALRPTWADTDSALQIGSLPDDWIPIDSAEDTFALTDSLEDLGQLAFAAEGPQGSGLALYLRPARVEVTQRANGKTRERRERYGDAAETLLETLGSIQGITEAREVPFERLARIHRAGLDETGPGEEDEDPKLALPFFADLLSWDEPSGTGEALHVRALVFKNGTSIGTLLLRSSEPEPVDEGFREVVSKLGYGDLEAAYGRLLRFDAGWRTNIVQSIASSILFAVLVLALGAWRLSRIDF